jgi:hypothetical protein
MTATAAEALQNGIGTHSQHACAASAHRFYRVHNQIQKNLL